MFSNLYPVLPDDRAEILKLEDDHNDFIEIASTGIQADTAVRIAAHDKRRDATSRRIPPKKTM